MDITRNGTNASAKGPADYFTGNVRLDTPFKAASPGLTAGAIVTFEPGARTAWHTHPMGQILIVTAGFGWAQSDGCSRLDIRPGDVIWFPPGERHWHGATDKTAMTHVAIAEVEDGSNVTWLEQVADEDYLAGSA